MERKFTAQLLKWKNSDSRMPLIVTGARQVGKTYGLLEFGKTNYQNFVYLNFENKGDLHDVFERDLNPERIIRELSVISGKTIFEGALAENYVFSALITNGCTPFYWESEGKAEVDFVIQNREGKIIPIEVKSTEHNRSRSLQQYVGKYKPEYSIRISAKNFGFENRIKSTPLYAVFLVNSFF
ncbi:MAG: ATP-binding protein [Prevotellaceae bacterium]|jgi:predicted AAA+ superfamily ATPase|nr:ATP-binding protein [Prevotellaceae bacterium]